MFRAFLDEDLAVDQEGRVVDAVVARNFGEVGDDPAARDALRKAMSRRVAVIFRPTRTASWDHRKTMSGATP